MMLATQSDLNTGINSPGSAFIIKNALSIIMRGLIYGMTVRLVEKFRAEEIERILANETVTIMSVVPFMIARENFQPNTTELHCL